MTVDLSCNGAGRILIVGTVLFLSGCSPYLYQDEIKTFGAGVETAVESLQAYLRKADAELQQQRIVNLKKAFEKKEKIGISTACVRLQKDLEAASNNPLKHQVNRKDLAKCQVLPVPMPAPGPAYPHFTALGQSLKHYSAALMAITNAADKDTLVSAASNVTSKINGLIGQVNTATPAKLDTTLLSPVGAVLSEGLTIYLDHRRFKTLKAAVEGAHPAIERMGTLVAKAMVLMFLDDFGSRYDKLRKVALTRTIDTGDAFVQTWEQAQKERDDMVKQLRNSPTVILRSMVASHKALLDSLSNPHDKNQLGAVIQNAKAFYGAARSLSDTLHGDNR